MNYMDCVFWGFIAVSVSLSIGVLLGEEKERKYLTKQQSCSHAHKSCDDCGQKGL